ncbi:MAG TPA: hypothetical protein VIV13_06340, partial [Solirubrobacterales bacterium]
MSGLLAAVFAQLSESDERGRVTPYVIAFAVGFFIAVAGHLTESRPLMTAIASEKPVVLLFDEIDKTDQEFEAMLLEIL